MENIQFRPIGELIQYLEELKYEVSYTYDDLIFVNNNTFILQHDEQGGKLFHLFFNVDCEPNAKSKILSTFKSTVSKTNFDIIFKGSYKLDSLEESNEINVSFYPEN